MRKAIPVVVLAATSLALACARDSGPVVDEAALTQAAHSDSVQTAVAAYDAAAYDSITWETPAARLDRGGLVFSVSCSKCHGMEGLGDANFVQRGDTLRPPSFVDPDWKFADDEDGLRQQVFTGTADGMPHWGLHGLKYRDIDAVAGHILNKLRGS